MQNGNEDLRDLRARQRFLQENISRNRAVQRGDGSVLADPSLVQRMMDHYDNIHERRYMQLRNRLSL